LNPHFYQAYNIAGDAFAVKGAKDSAHIYWKKALNLEIPKQMDSLRIREKIRK
jgi:predicted negative regulator of RcsB-dependent stress response